MASSSLEEQAQLDAALDAFLDSDGDDDDDDDNAEEQHVDLSHSASSSEQKAEPALDSAFSSVQPVTPLVKLGPPRPPPANSASERACTAPADDEWSSDKLFASMMEQMLEGGGRGMVPRDDGGDDNNGLEDEFMGRFMQEMQSQLQQANRGSVPNIKTPNKAKKTTTPNALSETKTGAAGTKASPSAGKDKEEVEAAIATLVEGLTKQATMDDDSGNNSIPPEMMDHDSMLNNLMESLAAGIGGGEGGDANPDAVIDGMMEQLLSKDFMYEPIKQVAIKFPDWLEARRNSLSPKEYTERCQQCQCFCKLVHVYETEPSNVGKLMELMQEVQEYGQPPVEIIREIAPGIELDDDGMPKLDSTGVPFPGNDECQIM